MWGKSHALSRRKIRIPAKSDFKVRLTEMLDRCAMSRAQLLRIHNAPPDLTAIKLGLILRRENTTILKTHAEFLERLIQERENL